VIINMMEVQFYIWDYL